MKKIKTQNKIKNILYRVMAKIWDTFSDGEFFTLTEIIISVVFSVVIVIIALVLNNPLNKIPIVFVLFVLFAFADMGIYLATNRWDFTFEDEDNGSDPISNNETYFTDTQDTAIEKICETTKYYYPEIEEKIKKIDNKLEDGYVFSDMKTEKWKTAYKQEILDLMRSQYKISDENQQRILKLLQRLNDSLINKKELYADFETEVNISALEKIADLDLVGSNNFRIGEIGKK